MTNVLDRTPRFPYANTDANPPAVTRIRHASGDRYGTGLIVHLIIMVALAILISGCATPLVHIEPPQFRAAESSRVLLMPVDARMHVITAGGTREERADWTEQSRANLTTALREDMSAREIELVPYREFGTTVPWDPDHARMIKLHEIVSSAIMGANQLPTKRRLHDETGDLDYSLGETVLDIGDSYSADYALLVHVNAGYPSTGRAALAIVGTISAIVTGVGVVPEMNTQYAVASLIDLRDGSIVWFDTALGASGDTREQSGAQRLVDTVLGGLPL